MILDATYSVPAEKNIRITVRETRTGRYSVPVLQADEHGTLWHLGQRRSHLGMKKMN
jgi:hypothetical protein